MASSNTRSPRWRGLRRAVGEIALTLTAVAGVAVTAVTVTAAHTGIQPLVVRSGSMEPTIPAGSMILVERVEAAAIEVGEIVAVERPDHTRVTHRVVAIARRGEVADLTLKGDANEDRDPVPVTVDHAYRLRTAVPAVGRAMGWLATAQGGFVMGSVATAFVCHVLHRRSTARRAPALSGSHG